MPQPQSSRAEEGPLTQAERTALSDRRMFEAAIELINEFGTRKMTLKEIGERAGYSRGLASYRFGSKDGLLRELFVRFDKRWKEHLGERLQGKRGIEAIRAGIHAQRDFHRPQPVERVLRLIRRELPRRRQDERVVRTSTLRPSLHDADSWMLHEV